MITTIHLKNGKVFDPTNRVFNKKKDIFISDGKPVSHPEVCIELASPSLPERVKHAALEVSFIDST